MRLEYPREWLGNFNGRAKNGSIELIGEGLEDVERHDGRVSARKGEGGSEMMFEIMKGNASVRIGD